MEKPIQSKPQSPVIQATARSPKFSHLKQSEAQSKPTTPEKTDLTNGAHDRSGSEKVSSENGDTPRERSSSLSGMPHMLGEGQESGNICRKPVVVVHLFLGLPLDFLFAFLSWNTTIKA